MSSRLRVAVAAPLTDELHALIENVEPRVELLRDTSLVAPMRWAADFSGDPGFHRTPGQQSRFEALLDSADALYGIPDIDPGALSRTVRANPDLRWAMGQVVDQTILTFAIAAGPSVSGNVLLEFS